MAELKPDSETESLDVFWMQHALALADRAAQLGEVPIGAVLVKEDCIIGEGWNAPISSNDPTAHAEINAIRAAAARIGNYRLLDTTLYVTVEPCVMCAGAIIHARIKAVIYGASEPKTGAAGSAFNLLDAPQHNHVLSVRRGVLAHESITRLQAFFRSRR